MKALVFHRPGHVEINQVEDPKIEQSDDIILRVTSTAICGSDLHILNGFIPQKNDLVLGHEFMGVVEETGRDVKTLIRLDDIITHRLSLDEAPHAYQIFRDKEDN